MNYYGEEPLATLCLLLKNPRGIASYKESEGNVESYFVRTLLEEIAFIPREWISYQQKIGTGRSDVKISLNEHTVLIVECKRFGKLTKRSDRQNAVNQVFRYARDANCMSTLVTDGERLYCFESEKLIIACETESNWFYNFDALSAFLSPSRLYNHSRKLYSLKNIPDAFKLLSYAQNDQSFKIDQAIKKAQELNLDTHLTNVLCDELKSWNSLWNHFKISSSLIHERKIQNLIIHVDYSYITYFDGCWYYDSLHWSVRSNEERLTRKIPGVAIRAFIYPSISVFFSYINSFKQFIKFLLNTGYRIAFIDQRTWETQNIHLGHIDIIANLYAKKYENEYVLEGVMLNDRLAIKSLRQKVIDAILAVGVIFEPTKLEFSSYCKFREWLTSKCALDNEF